MAIATVEYVALRNDLVNLPTEQVSLLFNSNTPIQKVVIEISPVRSTGSKIYVGWTGHSSSKAGTIEIDPTFALNAGLRHGSSVAMVFHVQSPLATTVHLEPATPEDWEIVETNAFALENCMIAQVRAVSIGAKLTVYPSATSIACLQVKVIDPIPDKPYALLAPEAEIIIAPKQRLLEKPKTVESREKTTSMVFRSVAYPYGDIPESKTRSLVVYGDIAVDYVTVSVVEPYGTSSSEQTVSPDALSDDELRPAKDVVARVVRLPRADLIISYGLSAALSCVGSVGTILRLKPAGTQTSGTAKIHPYNPDADDSLVIGSKHDLSNLKTTLDLEFVTNGQVIPPCELLKYGGIISANSPWMNVDSIQIAPELPVPRSSVPPLVSEIDLEPSRPVVSRDSILEQIENACLAGLGTLVYGTRNSGKSTILDAVARHMKKNLVKPVIFPCSTYINEPLSSAKEAISKTLLLAAWHAPSIVLFDDLDKLMPADQENSDTRRSTQLVEVLRMEIDRMRLVRPIVLLASSSAKQSLHLTLTVTHVFDVAIQLSAPSKEMRENIMVEALQYIGLSPDPTFDRAEVAAETEGYQPGDLWVLAERTATYLQSESIENADGVIPKVVNSAQVLAAAKDFTPASLRGIKLQKSTTRWCDIGGLANVKRTLLETLEWPTKYAPIFKNCPLRLRSGLLLFGYPGCGKTLLASAVAAQCGLNFISIKGPEILNKYIGASEQNVRELFERAQAAKPCVLFFDEFDSIAPKRGHDSTGVTDRVVNQMLTQMDGAEGLDGVYVLAATSRPELIDSALLRPGRLDKVVLCDMPNESDRVDIMRACQTKMALASDVDLEALSKQTEGFTGADIQALMYNAFLEAVHDSRESDSELIQPDTTEALHMFHIGGEADDAKVKAYVQHTSKVGFQANGEASKVQVVVTQAHLEAAVRGTNPSVSDREVRRLRSIYEQFLLDRSGDMPNGKPSDKIGGRVSLK